MVPLQRLEVFNFQVHRYFDLRLGPGLTTIIGHTDAGKSALLRCLSWVSFNQPSGEEFRTWEATFVKGKLHFTDGSTITRVRGKSNAYLLNSQRFDCIDRGKVPEAIANLLQVGDVNFQRQIEGPFWFCESPAQVSRELNQIVDLGVIDEALTRAANEVRKAKAVEEVCRERLAQSREKKQSLKWAIKYDAALKRIESQHQALAVQQDTLARQRLHRALLASLAQKANWYAQRRRGAANADLALTKAVTSSQAAVQASQRLTTLAALLREAGRYRQRKPLPDIRTLERKLTACKEVVQANVDLARLISTIKESQDKKCQLQQTAAAIEAELKGLLQQGITCPTCEQKIQLPSSAVTST